MKNIKTLSFFGIILTNILWGMSYVWSGELLLTMSSISIITLRTAIASVVLCLIVLFTKSNMKVSGRKDWFMLIGMALCQPFLYTLCELAAIRDTSPTFVSLLLCAMPILVPYEQYMTEGVKVSPRLKYGILISIIGVVIVILSGSEGSELIKTEEETLAKRRTGN